VTTIVAFKENNRWNLAADSRVSGGVPDFDDTFEKLVKTGTVWYSIAGDARLYMKMVRQADPESTMELLDQFKCKAAGSMLAITPSGSDLWLLETTGYIQQLKGRDFYAIGSGAKYVLGALTAGASIEDAFKIVKKYDIGTGGPVKTTRKWK
jgi:ATP-dependent protease HslVU (ClpYQ) peptidase subunit